MNPWLIDHLVRSGALTESGLTRRARPRRCPGCGTWTLAGLDADVCALEAHADPTPLTPLGEVAALLGGVRTVELVNSGGRHQLEQRLPDHIEGRPACSGRFDVLALHRCGQPIPRQFAAASAFTPKTAAATTEEPPF